MFLCHDADHLALLRVHVELELLLQIRPAGFQQSQRCSSAFREYDNVIRIADDRHAPAFHLLIKFVQIDVR
ncbi:hypothetical protein D3C76_1561850 [compost metagenome]